MWLATDLGSVDGVVVLLPDGTERMLVPGVPEPVAARFLLRQVLIELRS